MLLNFTIKLKPDTQPYAVLTSRNIPVPLQGTVQAAVTRMVLIQVIFRVDKLRSAGMVMVPKKSRFTLNLH